ncbi:hypothetical protein GCM10010428_67030 [Actinosynnema pretiosum subsp. pretiosum]
MVQHRLAQPVQPLDPGRTRVAEQGDALAAAVHQPRHGVQVPLPDPAELRGLHQRPERHPGLVGGAGRGEHRRAPRRQRGERLQQRGLARADRSGDQRRPAAPPRRPRQDLPQQPELAVPIDHAAPTACPTAERNNGLPA